MKVKQKGKWKNKKTKKLLKDTVDFGSENIMKYHCFNEIKKFFPFAFYDMNNKEDPWHPIGLLVDGFNNNRKKNIAALIIKVFDESMSAWKPQTTQLGGLPNISYIIWKPEPLGTEFKSTACSKTGMLLHLEIQQGKYNMKKLPYYNELGATAACSLQMAEATKYSAQEKFQSNSKTTTPREIYYGNSWFASVKLAEKLACKNLEFGGIVKTNSSCFPKEEVEALMKDWPSGSHIVLQCKTWVENNILYCVGYKYLSKKALCFVFTEGCCDTTAGEPYVAKFSNQHGNTMTRDVNRPHCISDFFAAANIIDSHNQGRQFELALEKHWITQDCWFRLDTTFIGMVVVDCWKALRYHLCSHAQGSLIVKEFAEQLAIELIHNPFADHSDNFYLQTTTESAACVPCEQINTANDYAKLDMFNIIQAHRLEKTTRIESNVKPRIARLYCRKKGCREPTPFECYYPACQASVRNVNGKEVMGVF